MYDVSKYVWIKLKVSLREDDGCGRTVQRHNDIMIAMCLLSSAAVDVNQLITEQLHQTCYSKV